MARICVPLIWYTPQLGWLTLELERLNHLPDGLRIPLLFERLSWMKRIAIMRRLKKTRNAFAFRSRTYCPKKSVRHCLAMALRYAGQTTHIKHCRYICNIFFATLRYRMQVRHWDGNTRIRFWHGMHLKRYCSIFRSLLWKHTFPNWMRWYRIWQHCNSCFAQQQHQPCLHIFTTPKKFL